MLTIQDLSITHTLDRETMAELRGGYAELGWPGYGPSYVDYHSSFSFDATQQISQLQGVEVNTGNNVAFSSGISAVVKPTQNAQNNISGYGF